MVVNMMLTLLLMQTADCEVVQSVCKGELSRFLQVKRHGAWIGTQPSIELCLRQPPHEPMAELNAPIMSLSPVC